MTYLDVEHADLLLLDILLLRNLGESVELYRRMSTISTVFFEKSPRAAIDTVKKRWEKSSGLTSSCSSWVG